MRLDFVLLVETKMGCAVRLGLEDCWIVIDVRLLVLFFSCPFTEIACVVRVSDGAIFGGVTTMAHELEQRPCGSALRAAPLLIEKTRLSKCAHETLYTVL